MTLTTLHSLDLELSELKNYPSYCVEFIRQCITEPNTRVNMQFPSKGHAYQARLRVFNVLRFAQRRQTTFPIIGQIGKMKISVEGTSIVAEYKSLACQNLQIAPQQQEATSSYPNDEDAARLSQ